MTYVLELNGLYFTGKKNDGRYIAKCGDVEWCNKWVILLNENPLKEAYLTDRNM